MLGHLTYFLKDFAFYLLLLVFSTVITFALLLKVYKAHISDNRKNILMLCIFTLISLIYIYSGFEAYFRYRYDQTDGLGFLQTNQRWMQRHVQYNNIIYRDNKDYVPQKPDGVVRIGVVGDSLTFGWGIKDVNNRFSNLLETKLRQRGYNVQVYNFGIPGQNTCNEMQQFKQVDYIPMDMMIWEYYFNGIEPCDSRNAGNKVLQEAAASQENPVRVFLSHNSFFFDYLYWRFTSFHDTIYRNLRTADINQYSNPGVFKDHVKDIATLSAELKFSGNTQGPPRKVIAIFFPLLNLWSPTGYPGVAAEKKMTTIVNAQGIPVVDMLSSFTGKTQSQLTENRFDAHPNEYANALAADRLYTEIVPLLTKTPDGKTKLK